MAARRVSQASMQNIFSGFLPAEVVNSVAAAPVDTTTASETDILFTTAQASAEAGLQQVIEELGCYTLLVVSNVSPHPRPNRFWPFSAVSFFAEISAIDLSFTTKEWTYF